MKIPYEDLFKLAREPGITVADCWVDNDCFVDFKRSLSMLEFERWFELKGELSNVSLEQDSNDTIRWGLETKGHFTAKSLYRFMISGGMPNRMVGHIWKCKVPLK